MTKAKHSSENNKFKLSSIVERLPLLRFLDESKATLLKLQPSWQAWLERHLPSLCAGSAHLSAYDANSGQLTICADNASTAALIKHQQASLLASLQSAIKSFGNDSISKIKVRIDLESTSAATELLKTITQHQPEEPRPSDNSSSTFSHTAIESIKHLQGRVKNPELAQTLSELAITLSKQTEKKTD